MTTVECGPFILSSDFDSGNFLKVEYVQAAETSSTGQNSCTQLRNFDHEISLWTKPDCYGTRFENGNKTWFYFSVRSVKGGRYGVVKFNILNLNNQTKLFQQGMQPVYRVLPHKPDWDRIPGKLLINEPGQYSVSFNHRLPDNPNVSTLYFAFTWPFSYHENLELLNMLDEYLNPLADLSLTFKKTSEFDVYYHRECVCYSYEGRRVELLTVTSMNGASTVREETLSNLFPDASEIRPLKFPKKKVVFMSARVHPGETPSSFVLNGFLRFLLDPDDPRAILLRSIFVFKFIPILNPDGVAHGHYRTDRRGVNLNRMYMNPSPLLHPPIYAARKLLLYYHQGRDCPDDYEYPVDDNCDANMEKIKVDETGPLIPEYCAESPLVKCDKTSSTPDPDTGDVTIGVEHLDPVVIANSCSVNDAAHVTMTQESTDESTALSENLWKTNSITSSINENEIIASNTSLAKQIGNRTSTARKKKGGPKIPPSKSISTQSSVSKFKSANSASSSFFDLLNPSKSSVASRYKLRRKSMVKSALSNPVKKLSSPVSEEESGLFLYIDLHGHASKRGIFIYGNHFSEVTTQAEAMLLPKLMAINSPHFDFNACNFTERLMCLKDKRDGASREGSGRVACQKLTGLIRSYTLECNYNTGRLVNHVVSRPPSFGFMDASSWSSCQPPKFTISIFEGIGKAIAESLLDLTGHNPWSRLGCTEFRTLGGVRRSLTNRLKLYPEYNTSGTDITLKKSSSNVGSTLLSLPKVLRRPKSKVSVQSTLNETSDSERENQNLPNHLKSSGFQSESLSLPLTGNSPTPKPEYLIGKGATTPRKARLKKVLKKKSLTGVPIAKRKSKTSIVTVKKLHAKTSSQVMY